MFSRSLSGSTLPANWLIVVFKIALITFLLISTLFELTMLSNVSPISSMLALCDESSASSIKLLIKTFNVSNSVFQLMVVALSTFSSTTSKLSFNKSAFSMLKFLTSFKIALTIFLISSPNKTLCLRPFNECPKLDISVDCSESNAVFKSDAVKISCKVLTKSSTNVSSVCQLLTSFMFSLMFGNTFLISKYSSEIVEFK